MSAAPAQGALRFHGWNRRAVQARLIGVNDAGLRMRRISQGLAEQPSGRRGIIDFVLSALRERGSTSGP